MRATVGMKLLSFIADEGQEAKAALQRSVNSIRRAH